MNYITKNAYALIKQKYPQEIIPQKKYLEKHLVEGPQAHTAKNF